MSPEEARDIRRALRALDAVLALHARDEGGLCGHCTEMLQAGRMDVAQVWPCPTVRAIEGTEE